MDILRYPIYKKLQQLGLLGLQANVVYDVIQNNPMAMNDPLVNATVLDVDCGSLPEAHQDSNFGDAYADLRGWHILTGESTLQSVWVRPLCKSIVLQ